MLSQSKIQDPISIIIRDLKGWMFGSSSRESANKREAQFQNPSSTKKEKQNQQKRLAQKNVSV
jgi:hypothetical protein